jgi:hypothetical protein
MKIQDRLRDQAEDLLDVASVFDPRRGSVLHLTRDLKKHLPQDSVPAGELVVGHPPGRTGGFGKIVHAQGTEATFQEQTLGGFDNGLSRPATRRLEAGQRLQALAIAHLQISFALPSASGYCTYQCILLYPFVQIKIWHAELAVIGSVSACRRPFGRQRNVEVPDPSSHADRRNTRGL